MGAVYKVLVWGAKTLIYAPREKMRLLTHTRVLYGSLERRIERLLVVAECVFTNAMVKLFYADLCVDMVRVGLRIFRQSARCLQKLHTPSPGL